MDRFSSSSSDSSYYNGDDLKRPTGRNEPRKLWCTTALTNFTLSNSFKHVLSPRISPAQNVLKSSAGSIGSQVEALSPPPIIAATPARNIFLSTPCAVAGEPLSGKINVLPRAKLDRHSSQSLILELIGTEEVIECAQGNTKTHVHVFFKQVIDDWTYSKDTQRVVVKSYISFNTNIPDWLAGSYGDKHSRVHYFIRGTKQTGTNDSSGILVIEEEITIRAKIGQMTSGERSLYSSITERNVINSINYGGGDIILELALQRRIWVSGSTIFCSLRIKNHSKTMIKDVKVILLRRQNTYSQSSQNFQLMSVRSFCDVVSCTSIASLGSFDCLSSGQNENVILGLDTSNQHISVKNHLLIDVSYAIQASIETAAGVETMVEVPVTLVHPHSVEPPVPVNMYKQAISHSTFSKLMNRAFEEQHNDESESDDEDEPSRGDEFKSNFSIFRQRASFTVLHPTELGPSETLTRATLSSTQLKRSSQTHRVSIVQHANANATIQESIPQNPSSFERRLSSKAYIVRKGSKSSRKSSVDNSVISTTVSKDIWDDMKHPISERHATGKMDIPEMEPNSPHRHSINTVAQLKEQPRLNVKHRLHSFRNSLRV